MVQCYICRPLDFLAFKIKCILCKLLRCFSSNDTLDKFIDSATECKYMVVVLACCTDKTRIYDSGYALLQYGVVVKTENTRMLLSVFDISLFVVAWVACTLCLYVNYQQQYNCVVSTTHLYLKSTKPKKPMMKAKLVLCLILACI